MTRTSLNKLLASVIIWLAGTGVGLAQGHDYVFTGSVAFDDIGDYLLFDFDVPEGTTKIYVSYSYAPSAYSSANPSADRLLWAEWYFNSPDALVSDVIDIGLYDPDGFRGWSGSNKSSFTVALSSEHTTDSYTPGEMTPGTWQVELGIGFCMPGHVLNYTVNVDLSTEEVGEPFQPPDFTPVVLSPVARWYKGELHCHSTHSDGSRTLAEIYEFAYSIGLDFIAVTDHNAVSHHLYIPVLQDEYSDMLLLHGGEVTSYKGHFNAYNVTDYNDYHGTAPGYDINAVIDSIHERDGYMAPNHPRHPLIPLPGTFYGWGWGYADTDWSTVDYFEGVNGPSRVFGLIPNPLNAFAIHWWNRLQNEGFAVSMEGGSDDHQGGQGSGDTYSPIGSPTAVVYAEELSAVGILEGLKAGHAFVMTEGPDGPEIYLTASSGGNTAIIGDGIEGDYIDVNAEVLRGKRDKLTLYLNGTPIPGYANLPVDDNDFTLTFSIAPDSASRVHAELYDGLILKAITNPIFIAPAPADDDATPADDDSTPADDDSMPADDDSAPMDDDATPTDDDQVDDDAGEDDEDGADDRDVGCGC